jgi:hypothetical protein
VADRSITFDILARTRGEKDVDGLRGKLHALAVVGVGLAIAIGGKAVGAASDLNETISKSNTIFKGSAGQVQAWSKTAATSMGMSQNEALTAAAGFGNMFQQIGLGLPQATKMSTGMVQLSSDIASFNNADPSQVLDAMSGAFRGEYDAMQQYVPTINAATVQTEALRQTHKKSAKDLTDGEKAQAAYTLMMKGSSAAQGDFDRTSGGLANKQRILTAQWKDAQANLGNALLPALVKVAGAASNLAGFLDRNKSIIVPLVTVVGGLALAIWGVNAASNAYKATQAALNIVMAMNPIMLVVIAIGLLAGGIYLAWRHSETFRRIVTGAFNAVWGAAKTAFGWLRRNWPTVLAILTGPFGLAVLLITRKWDSIVGFVKGLKGKIGGAASGMWDGIKGAFKAAINWIIGGWNRLQFTMPSVDTHIPGVGRIGGWTLGLPDIPYLAHGGVITRPTLAVLGEAGREAVVPLDRAGGMGTTVNVTIQTGVGDPVAIGREVDRVMSRYVRANGGRRPAWAG